MRTTQFLIILMLLNYKVPYKSISYCLEEYIATKGKPIPSVALLVSVVSALCDIAWLSALLGSGGELLQWACRDAFQGNA